MTLAHEFNATATDIIQQSPGATELKRGRVAHGVIWGSEVILDLPPAGTDKVQRSFVTALEFGNALVRMRTNYPTVDADERTA